MFSPAQKDLRTRKRLVAPVVTALFFSAFMGGLALSGEPASVPCRGIPSLAASDGTTPVAVKVWTALAVGPQWDIPACLAWIAPRFGKLAVVSGSLLNTGGPSELLARFGAVSRLRGLTYWSVSDHRREPLILDSYAIDDLHGNHRRSDFLPVEMQSGRALFFTEQDNRATDRVVYKMTVSEATDDRVVLDIENVNAVRLLLFTMFGPGDLHSTYIMERVSDDLWSYYSITGVHENRLIRLRGGDSDKSYSNRALALYGSIVGESAAASLPWAK